VLVGLPGAGKTSVGRRVAELLGRPFLDFDQEIERRSGATVSALFAEQGEEAFRALEQAVSLECAGRAPMVLSPGGGWVTRPDTVALLRRTSCIIYLRARAESVLLRMGAARDDRPLLRGADPAGALHRLFAVREPLYLAADCVVDTEDLDVEQVARQVAALAAGRAGG
jgi:shikimate kinase